MAKVLITEQYLTDIADAIRQKKASEDTYNPSEMADAIESIQTGITPTGTKQVSITANGTTTEDVTNYANAEITVNVPSGSATLVTKSITENGTYNASSDSADGYSSVTVNVQGSGGGYVANDWLDSTKPVGVVESNATVVANSFYFSLANHTGITRISMPNAEWLPGSFARACTGVTSINFPKLKSSLGGQFIFYGMTSLEYAVLPAFENDGNGQFMGNCTSLKGIDFGGDANGTIHRLSQYSFSGCTKLNTIILRSTDMWALQNVNVFRSTPFASGGSGGTIYIPKALYDVLGTGSTNDYKAAASWSTMDGYGTITWAQIEGSIYETQYVDGSTIPTS